MGALLAGCAGWKIWKKGPEKWETTEAEPGTFHQGSAEQEIEVHLGNWATNQAEQQKLGN